MVVKYSAIPPEPYPDNPEGLSDRSSLDSDRTIYLHTQDDVRLTYRTKDFLNPRLYPGVYVLANVQLLCFCLPALLIGTLSWYPGLNFYVLVILMNASLIMEAVIKMFLLGPTFWTDTWHLPELGVALFGTISMSVMFVSQAGTVVAIIDCYVLLILILTRIARAIPFLSLSALERDSSQDIADRLRLPGAYVLLYLTVAAFSSAAFALGLDRWPEPPFFIISVLANTFTMCEVALRICVLRPHFFVSAWDLADLILCVFGVIGISTVFATPIGTMWMAVTCFLLLLRSTVQLIRLIVLMRVYSTASEARETHVITGKVLSIPNNIIQPPSDARNWPTAGGAIAGLRSLLPQRFHKQQGPIHIDEEQPLIEPSKVDDDEPGGLTA
ncbi:hypothetical protein GLOTRDRAFT_117368 [Gloeophyllum trabeum ATCC 11539]|uniref:Ion transport domain-containing protein n=1 Tax=Gloeophyllum trabeum (strain ATCC 11539 / FP-39264 / Madison 617) TaxID=670483 RepID=S7REA3_GLOTA|nr:uncharacterized protein GLOTRDRAFT_117368 [Gloeophyllum trabeum ATCC 11539]EPQ52525.1 hypothetical protein GLOTRDRAFT_117368 [Gloeophyllum trabeum ATCC 11539]